MKKRMLARVADAGIKVVYHYSGPETEYIGDTPNYVHGYDVTLARVDGESVKSTALHYTASQSEHEEIDHGPAGAQSEYVGWQLLTYQVMWMLLHAVEDNLDKPVSEWSKQAQQLVTLLGDDLVREWVGNTVD